MNDYTGREIEVGDVVAYIENGYRNFTTSTVTKVMDKKIAIGNTTRFGADVIITKKVVKEST